MSQTILMKLFMSPSVSAEHFPAAPLLVVPLVN